jgi:hypothetical protein
LEARKIREDFFAAFLAVPFDTVVVIGQLDPDNGELRHVEMAGYSRKDLAAAVCALVPLTVDINHQRQPSCRDTAS